MQQPETSDPNRAEPSNLAFVVFHAAIDNTVRDKIRQLSQSYAHFEQEELLQLAFKSARRFHPGCQCVILTDLKTEIAEDPSYSIYRFDVDIRYLIHAATFARLKYLKKYASPSHHVVFMDTDILIQDSLQHIFEKDFDVGLTYRSIVEQFPINTGVFFIHRRGLKKGKLFFKKIFFKIIRRSNTNDMTWWGDQEATRAIFGQEFLRTFPERIALIGEVKYYFLPADIYNFSTDLETPMIDYYPNKKILHFKGGRKIYMALYWKRYIEN